MLINILKIIIITFNSYPSYEARFRLQFSLSNWLTNLGHELPILRLGFGSRY